MPDSSPISEQETSSSAKSVAYGKEYAASIDTLIGLWADEFTNTAHTVKQFQFSAIKTYMWIASVVFAAQLSLYIDLSGTGSILRTLEIVVDTHSSLYKFLSYSSLALSLGTFTFGVDTMRGRYPSSKLISTDLDSLLDMAYEDCSKPYYELARTQILLDIDKALLHHRIISSERGEKMRIMSYGIIVSVALTLLTLFC